MGVRSTGRVRKARVACASKDRARKDSDFRDRARPAAVGSRLEAVRALRARGRTLRAPTGRFRIAAPAVSARLGRGPAAAQAVPTQAVPTQAVPTQAVPTQARLGPVAPVTAPRGRVASEPAHVPADSAPTARVQAPRAPAVTDRDRVEASDPALAPAASAPMRLGPTSMPEPIAAAAPIRPPGVSGSPARSGRLNRPDPPVVGSAARGRGSSRGPDLRRGRASRHDLRPATPATRATRPASTARPAAR